MIRHALAASALLLVLAGCSQEPEEGPSGPAKVAFSGKVDPSLAGTWKSADGGSVLTLQADGSGEIGSTFNTPKGKQSTSKKANWLTDSDRLLLKYKESDGSDTVISYAMVVSGKTMTLTTKSPQTKTVYQRQ